MNLNRRLGELLGFTVNKRYSQHGNVNMCTLTRVPGWNLKLRREVEITEPYADELFPDFLNEPSHLTWARKRVIGDLLYTVQRSAVDNYMVTIHDGAVNHLGGSQESEAEAWVRAMIALLEARKGEG